MYTERERERGAMETSIRPAVACDTISAATVFVLQQMYCCYWLVSGMGIERECFFSTNQNVSVAQSQILKAWHQMSG